MAPLALVLLVQHSTGSYAPAGTAAAMYALANAATSPLLGRLADRFGPTRVLLGAAAAYPVGVAAVLATVSASARVWAIWIASALCGACVPPLTAALRSVWTDLTEGPAFRLREPALALETTSFEVVFVVGPMLVGALTALASPGASLAGAAVLTMVGTAAVAFGRAARASRPHPDHRRARGLGPAAAPGMPMLLLVTFGLTFAFGVIGVTVPAFTGRHGSPEAAASAAGALLGLWGVGSVTGGVWFGTRRFSAPLPTQWAVTLSTVAVGMVALVVVPSVPVMAVALLAGGCTLAPALTVENALVARIAPPGMVNEAYTWLVTSAVAAGAAGSAVAGIVVDRPGGVSAAFALAAASTAMGAVTAAWPGSPLRRAARAAVPVP
jgi:MFS family permease